MTNLAAITAENARLQTAIGSFFREGAACSLDPSLDPNTAIHGITKPYWTSSQVV
jgi:hypothetical protein